MEFLFSAVLPQRQSLHIACWDQLSLKVWRCSDRRHFRYEANQLSFDNDSTNTYIQADADSPENLEIHADGNIELRADDDVQVIGDINIGGSATIDKVIADTTVLALLLILDTDAGITFLGTSSTSTTVGKVYYYTGSLGLLLCLATKQHRKPC